jgi:uracil phosphoribosyltransferase
MLATGGGISKAIQEVKQHQPACIKVATVIASHYGINKIHELDDKIDVFYACVDPKLNEKGYIVPGLGDAGDRSYGAKID